MSSQTNLLLSKEAEQALSKTKIKNQLRETLSNLVDTDNVFDNRLNLTWSQFRDTYLYHTVFDKYVTLETSDAEKRFDACLTKYLDCEERCRRTNEVFRNKEYKQTKFHHILMLARQELSNILGPFDKSYLHEHTGFGPGSTTRLKRPFIDAAFKFEGVPTTTYELLREVGPITERVWSTYQICSHAKFTTVPKNALTDRPIEIQNDLNVFFQKSLGSSIRSLMRGQPIGYLNMRIDLNDQSINRELAREGSLTGEICTLDLSSASDLIAYELVNFLIEDSEWFHALLLCRMGSVQLPDGKVLELEKFSAMGNGYTWELQSAIFYCFIKAVSRYNGSKSPIHATFGDDIICHKDDANLLIETLQFCGLLINRNKSFISGKFRESCGGHYYEGVDVTPFYIRGPVKSELELIKYHNRLFEWSTKLGYKDARCKTLLDKLRGYSKFNDFLCPAQAGDVGFKTCRSDVPFVLKFFYKNWTEKGYLVNCLIERRSILHWCGIGSYWKRLHAKHDEETSAGLIPFGTGRVSRQRLFLREWPCFGVWL